MEHRKALFTYLADIEEQASEMFESLVRDMKKAEGVTEQLKADEQWEWICRMENIRNRAREIVKKEFSLCIMNHICFCKLKWSGQKLPRPK